MPVDCAQINVTNLLATGTHETQYWRSGRPRRSNRRIESRWVTASGMRVPSPNYRRTKGALNLRGSRLLPLIFLSFKLTKPALAPTARIVTHPCNLPSQRTGVDIFDAPARFIRVFRVGIGWRGVKSSMVLDLLERSRSRRALTGVRAFGPGFSA